MPSKQKLGLVINSNMKMDVCGYWKNARLDEIGEVILGQSPPGETYNLEQEGLPFFQGKAEFGDLYPTPIKWCSKPKKIAEPDDVLISVRAPVGPTNLSPSRACIGRGLAAIRPKQGMPSKYLLYALRATVDFLTEKATGSTFEAINGKDLKSHIIPVAPPYGQVRIVEEIEKQFTRLDAGIAALKRAQSNLKRYRAAVLKAACEGRLVESDVTKWKKVQLKEVIGSMKNGIYKPRSSYAERGVACLRMYNIENGKIVWKDIKRMNLSSKEIDEYQLLSGDLLVNRVNSRELVGKSAPILPGIEKCVFESKNIRIRLKHDLADYRFIGFVMSVYGPIHFSRNAQQVVGMASISQSQIGSIELSLPSLIEQKRIVAEVDRRLSVIEELEALYVVNMKRANRLRQAILQSAFMGEQS